MDELHKHLVRSKALMARGKFDILRRDSSCLLRAFRQLLVQLLSSTDVGVWRSRVLHALGPNAAVMVDAVPELSHLLGDLPSVPALNPTEAYRRFERVFVQFVKALSPPHAPMALFLDDMQWSDSGSVALLQLLMSQESLPMLIILAYRGNEVDQFHPLSKLLATTRENTPHLLTEVQLRPLSAEHVTQLLSDTFRCAEERVAPLAALLSTKTQGNAFFLQTCGDTDTQNSGSNMRVSTMLVSHVCLCFCCVLFLSLFSMLRSFNKSGLVRFDVVRGEWLWDLEAIRLVPVPDDVVDVLCAQIRTMPPDTQHLLQFAACSGSMSNLQAAAAGVRTVFSGAQHQQQTPPIRSADASFGGSLLAFVSHLQTALTSCVDRALHIAVKADVDVIPPLHLSSSWHRVPPVLPPTLPLPLPHASQHQSAASTPSDPPAAAAADAAVNDAQLLLPQRTRPEGDRT